MCRNDPYPFKALTIVVRKGQREHQSDPVESCTCGSSARR